MYSRYNAPQQRVTLKIDVPMDEAIDLAAGAAAYNVKDVLLPLVDVVKDVPDAMRLVNFGLGFANDIPTIEEVYQRLDRQITPEDALYIAKGALSGEKFIGGAEVLVWAMEKGASPQELEEDALNDKEYTKEVLEVIRDFAEEHLSSDDGPL